MRYWVVSAVVGFSLLSLPAQSEAETPRGKRIWTQPAPGDKQLTPDRPLRAAPMGTPVQVAPEDGVAESHTSNLIYLNPCWGGCTFTGGWPNNSATNRASVVQNGTARVSEYAFGQASWNALVQCVREMYEPFDIEITDVDPGNAPHFEAVVAGTPQEIGMGSGTGGVSPFTCGIINNAITFSFANIYGGSVQQVCEVVAQESAHAFGLEHEYHCPDPMTYLSGCGAKKFRDVDAQCGEFSARSCDCGGSTQNSVAFLNGHFGAGQPTPPVVTITEPVEGATVQPGFVVRLDATDNVQVVRTELWINNQKILELTSQPFVFNAPVDLGQGNVIVEVRAYDNRGDMGKDTITVALGEPCKDANDCDGTDTCVDGRCVPGPGDPGGLGEPCTDNTQCQSGVCGSAGDQKYCTELCDLNSGFCPNGFDCLNAGSSGVCWPNGGSKEPPSTGGCAAGSSAPGSTLALLLLVGLALSLRRRRTN